MVLRQFPWWTGLAIEVIVPGHSFWQSIWDGSWPNYLVAWVLGHFKQLVLQEYIRNFGVNPVCKNGKMIGMVACS